MALLRNELSVWEIAFRWAGRNPDSVWLRLPLQVRDNFRMLMDAILNGHLDCSTLLQLGEHRALGHAAMV